MPSEAEHEAAYQDNRAQLNANPGILQSCPRWGAVIAFYAAVHLVERLAAREGIDHQGHSQRETWLARHGQHGRRIYRQYLALKTASVVARYEPLTRFQSSFGGNMVESILVNRSLAHIEAYVASVVNPPPSSGTGS